MGLNATLKKAAQSALKTTGDLADRIIYVQRTFGAYDPTTDTRTVTEVTHANVPALLCRFQEEDADWYPTNAKGQKLLIAYLDLPIATVAHRAGFVDAGHFSRRFRQAYGLSPTRWRQLRD